MNIFISGCYGVGKTYISTLLSKALNIPHFSASDLIKHSRTQKRVEDVEDNQKKLISSLKNLNIKSPTVILDGHFCIIGDDGIANIETEDFKRLNLGGVVVLTQSKDEILRRLKNRDGEIFNLDFIDRLQNRELAQAKIVANELKIPILIVESTQESIPTIESFVGSLNGQL